MGSLPSCGTQSDRLFRSVNAHPLIAQRFWGHLHCNSFDCSQRWLQTKQQSFIIPALPLLKFTFLPLSSSMTLIISRVVKQLFFYRNLCSCSWAAAQWYPRPSCCSKLVTVSFILGSQPSKIWTWVSWKSAEEKKQQLVQLKLVTTMYLSIMQ